MEWLSNDRLGAVAALQRRRGAAKAAIRELAESQGEPDLLARLVGATVERNRYGEFLRVRRWLPELEPCANPKALALAAPIGHLLTDIGCAESWLFLDTETTGLAGGTGTCAFLIGLAWWDAGGLAIEQFFLRDYDEEHAVLLAVAQRLAERRILVTFNGKRFDWPLLETRFRLTRQIEPEPPHVHLDLLHPARDFWRLQLGSARLATLERGVLGIERGPDVLSDLIPQIYFNYLRGASPEPLAAVFRHNQMDLAGLAALASRIAQLLTCPEGGEPLELYGLSRLLERRGERGRARRVYQMALDAGLPASLSRAARRRLARLARREGESDVARKIWQELAVEETDTSGADSLAERKETLETMLEACEQLAIHYEHRARNRAEALAWTRRAIDLLREAPATDGRFRHRWHERLRRRSERLRPAHQEMNLHA
jgi:hypothetical protein